MNIQSLFNPYAVNVYNFFIQNILFVGGKQEEARPIGIYSIKYVLGYSIIAPTYFFWANISVSDNNSSFKIY